jgi:hypothetical protein
MTEAIKILSYQFNFFSRRARFNYFIAACKFREEYKKVLREFERTYLMALYGVPIPKYMSGIEFGGMIC